jgi:hypothetical protein
MSIFFKQSKVGFGTRARYYSAEFRDSNAHAFLNKKIAYCNASCGGSSLTVSEKGGIGNAGMYHGAHRFPDPHITSVKISNEGDLGSLRKVQLDFMVYDLGSLQACSGFFKLNSNLSLNYGWNNAGGAGGAGSFLGTVYNFSYSVNTDGSFNCTTYAMSRGVNVLGVSYKGATVASSEISDPTEVTIKDHDIFGVFNVAIATLKVPAGTYKDGYATVEIPDGIADPPAPAAEGETAPELDLTKKKPYYYVSLGTIIDVINSKLISKLPNADSLKIKHGENDTCLEQPAAVGSSNPLDLIVPYKDNYGENLNCCVLGASPVTNLDRLLVSNNFIQKIAEDASKQSGEQDKKQNETIMFFLNKIFLMIVDRSAGLYKPAISQNQKGEWHLVNMNEPIPKGVELTVIPSVTKNSVTRAMTLQSKIPSEMQTVAFVGGTSALTSTTSANVGTISANGGSASDTTSDGADAVKAATESMNKGGITPEMVNQLSAALKKVQAEESAKQPILFPIDFSATVDGVEGFEFGDAVTTNYLPAGYAGRVAWTVTKVDHNISGGDWTTTISTVCRLL